MRTVSKYPHTVWLELTQRCNLTCVHCLADASLKTGRDELSTAEWTGLVDRLRELMVFQLYLTGGEIFLRKDLFDILTHIRRSGSQAITIFSNGTCITTESARQLAELRIRKVNVSLDGVGATHDLVRGKGSFHHAIAGIERLVAVGIAPQVLFTPMRNNFRDLGPLVDFLAEVGVSRLSVNTLAPEGRCIPVFKELALRYPDEVSELLSVVRQKTERYREFSIRCEMGFYSMLPRMLESLGAPPLGVKHLKDGCSAAMQSCEVTSNGDVIPCTGLAGHVGGNVRRQDFSEIWRSSSAFQQIRALASIPMTDVPHCRDCSYNMLCDGGCRANALAVSGDILAPSPWCPHWEGCVLDRGAAAQLTKISPSA